MFDAPRPSPKNSHICVTKVFFTFWPRGLTHGPKFTKRGEDLHILPQLLMLNSQYQPTEVILSDSHESVSTVVHSQKLYRNTTALCTSVGLTVLAELTMPAMQVLMIGTASFSMSADFCMYSCTLPTRRSSSCCRFCTSNTQRSLSSATEFISRTTTQDLFTIIRSGYLEISCTSNSTRISASEIEAFVQFLCTS